MSIVENAPIACSLTTGANRERLSWIAALNRDALRSHSRRGLVLELRYAAEARARVHELVRREGVLRIPSLRSAGSRKGSPSHRDGT